MNLSKFAVDHSKWFPGMRECLRLSFSKDPVLSRETRTSRSVPLLLLVLSLLLLPAAAGFADTLDGLLAWWPLDGNALDASGNGNDGEIVGPVSCEDRFYRQGGAMCFDGDPENIIDIGNQVKPSFPFTMTAWVNPEVIGTMYLLNNDSDIYYYYGARMRLTWDGRLGFSYGDGGYAGPASRTNGWTSETVVTPLSWQHVAVVFNAHRDVRLYWNCSKYPVVYGDGFGSGLAYSTASGAIGYDLHQTRPYQGAIDGVRVYRRALSDDEIAVLCTEVPPGMFGEGLQTADSYTFFVQEGAEATDSIFLYNPGTEDRLGTIRPVNPYSDLSVVLQSNEAVVVPPAAAVEVVLDVNAGSAAAGLYDGILLEIAVDDGSTLYSNLEVQVVEEPRPDLALTTADLSALRDEVAGTATLQAVIHNQGQEPAANVEVAFYEFGTLLGTTTIDAIPAGESAQTSLVVPIANDGDHLFRVVADPNAVIAEGDETNNEASFVASWNTPAATEGLILVTGNLPSTVYADSLFALAGQAVYELYIDGERNIDYVLKGGSVEVTIKAEDGTEWHYGGIYTDVNGDFRKTLLAPTVPGTYRVLMTVSDETFSGTRELMVTVEEPPAEEPAPPSAPTTTGEGYWSYELVEGEWVWVWYWDTLPVGEPVLDSDLWVHSEDLYFSDTHPAADDEITVFTLLHYWAESTALLAENVPVNLYAIDPATATRALIGRTLIPSLTVGPPDYGLRYIYATWRNRGDGIYLIETEIDPSYQEENLLNNAATRAIIVGDVLPTGQGAIAGQVSDPWGSVADVVVRVLAADGSELASTLTDATGYYLAENIPVGEQAVHIEVPTGYAADPASQPVIVEDQVVSSADFALTLACNPPEPPTGLKVALTRQYAFVRWSASEGAEEYVIYRRIDGQDPFQQIGTSTQTTFRDRDYGRDDEFDLLEYYVVATNGCGASEPSDVATVRPRGRQ